jgi:AraC-like DNA-binding protein
MGPHGMASMTERTVGEALRKTWDVRYNYNLLVDWEYEKRGNLLVHYARSREPDRKLRIFLLERSLATLQAHTEELLGADAKPMRVLFDYKTPKNVDQYKKVFRCPLRFSQEQTQIEYLLEWYDQNIETHDPQAGDVLGALRTSLHEKLSTGGDIVHDVKMALRRKPGEFPSLERVADDFAMSSRTLRRKLGQQQVRYQDLLDEERRRVAEDFLLNTTMTIQQVADQCGFTDAQNFSQAFRRWLGVSPTEFRTAHKP